MSTVAPPFSSASTTCSWPSWHAYIIAVQPSWSGTIKTGAHSDEECELTPTGSKTVDHCFPEMCTACRIILVFLHKIALIAIRMKYGCTVCGSKVMFCELDDWANEKAHAVTRYMNRHRSYMLHSVLSTLFLVGNMLNVYILVQLQSEYKLAVSDKHVLSLLVKCTVSSTRVRSYHWQKQVALLLTY